MSNIKFDKSQLVNLETSLNKELLRSNRAGSYASTTIVGCNTRKYHGLLVALQPQIDSGHHVMLSNLDVTLIQRDAEFNLGIHNYGENVYEPGGHKYIQGFASDPIPKTTYRVGGAVLTKERIFVQHENRILIRYKIENANSPVKLRFRPLLGFRSVHSLSKKNDYADMAYQSSENGIKVQMYENYSPLFLQFSRKVSYGHQPDWYYDIEYPKERTRGYDFKEDLYSPGTFEITLKKGDVLVFSAGLSETKAGSLKTAFINEQDKRIPRDTFKHSLINAAQQFFIKRDGKTEIIAGYHWFDMSGRDTFVALPGLTLPQGDTARFLSVTDTMVSRMNGAFMPSGLEGGKFLYDSVDASLWFIRALQIYIEFTGDDKLIWKKYGKVISKILNGYRKGASYHIYMLKNGLLSAGEGNEALTWMNTVIDEKPVVNRNGLAVEINALWYNAIKFYIDLIIKNKAGENEGWEQVAIDIEASFTSNFWDPENKLMADVVRGDHKDFSTRVNQVIGTGLPYSPVDESIRYEILQTVEQELLTPRGLRSLSPKNPDYRGVYKGNIFERDRAYHQGSAFPWLLGYFAEGYLKLQGKSGLSLIRKIYLAFEEAMGEHGLGTISELYYGDPPHKGKGAISQAWNVAELLRIDYLINKYNVKP
ncbi:MAG: amylo-alpha-1,6-glucosidase [Bacteroidetes bacterium]|nr:MAG: amylo-alpha-1,6-glucosidase [Bacteroidota bacterium]